MIELVQYIPSYKSEVLPKIADFFGYHASLLGEQSEIDNDDIRMANETLEEWLGSNQQLYLISYNNQFVGFIRYGYRGGDVVWIEDIYVDTEMRNRGIATAAIQSIEKLIQQDENNYAICFDVVPRNEKALRLYHKLGYDSLSLITVRKELKENKRVKTIEILRHKFKI
jgi:ribosomal protein S18 acetylase RimI-like enzyme